MMQRLRYGESDIPYKVFFVPDKKQKITIHVHPDSTVQVDAPVGVPLADIKMAVSKRSRWLYSHLEQTHKQYEHVLPREYISGECYFYLGKRYVLKIFKNVLQPSGVKLRQGQLQVTSDDIRCGAIKLLLWGWYQEHAEKIFNRRLQSICAELQWVNQVPKWKLLTMKKQWGNCSPKGLLSLNAHLVKAPAQCIDYVLIHELCHLKVHNHGDKFYKLLASQIPDWESVKGRLDGMAEIVLNE